MGDYKSLESFVTMLVESDETLVEQVAEVGKDINQYKMLFLEKGDVRYFFAVGKGKFEAIEFVQKSKPVVMRFGSEAELSAFVSSKVNDGFVVLKKESGIKKFLRLTLRSLAMLLVGVGVAGIVLTLVVVAKVIFTDMTMTTAESLWDMYKSFNGFYDVDAGAMNFATGTVAPVSAVIGGIGWIGLNKTKK